MALAIIVGIYLGFLAWCFARAWRDTTQETRRQLDESRAELEQTRARLRQAESDYAQWEAAQRR